MIENFLFASKEDQVAVFDQSFNQVFVRARAIKADVKVESKLMEHPVETGSIIIDHKIDLPIEIELSVVLSSDAYSDVYYQIYNLKQNATILSVQTKASTYENMVITSIPHQEVPEMFDHIALQIKLKQVILVEAQFGAAPKVKPRSTNKNSTVDRGQIQAKAPTSEQSQKGESVLSTFFQPKSS